MTIDKIKHYMDPVVFNHWTTLRDTARMKAALKILESEVENGLLVGIQYHAEIELLKHLLS